MLTTSRRNFLRAGFLGLGSLSLADLFRLRAEAGTTTDTAVILVFLGGGPSHLETYDMKPGAPDDIRGPFRPIATTVPGIEVCEHMPRHARLAHRFTLIRSCTHNSAGHGNGTTRMLSGHNPRVGNGAGFETGEAPEVGAMINWKLRDRWRGMPPAVVMGANATATYVPGNDPAYLGAAYRPPRVDTGIPSTRLRIPTARLDERLALRSTFDRMHRELDAGTLDSLDQFQRQALTLMLNDRVQAAFDVSREPAYLRERYGESRDNQKLLLARRLVEAGVNFVTVSGFGRGDAAGRIFNWDDHAVNWNLEAAMRWRLPHYDQGLTALIEDIYARGLDRKVLVIATGEFGRTPRLERGGVCGRDHYPFAMSILVSGGGMRMGQVIGATNAWGERPKERPLDPCDILATVYKHLGIDHTETILDPTGRPQPIARGTPVDELW
jgi:uncharacterized protein (DUF1501 family)